MRRKQQTAWLMAAAGLAGLAGCVERRFVVITDPPGAIVYDEKHRPLGMAPADRQFTYYGKYKFTLIQDGYQTQVVEEHINAPWYEYFPLEFISENLIPWTIRDRREFTYKMVPAPIIDPQSVLDKGTELRGRGQAEGEKLAPEVAPPRPVPVPVMPKAP